jgi:predicted CXXCH cytochrome family protein
MLCTSNILLMQKTCRRCDVHIKVDFCMTDKRPVTRLPFAAAPGFWPGLHVLSLVILVAGIFGAASLSAQAPPTGTTTQNAPPKVTVTVTAQSEFVGSEACATCHEEVSKRFADNPHTKMALQHGNQAGVTCENCHGAGRAHVEGGGDVTKIFNPANHSSKEVDETCLTCHAGAHPNFEDSPHAKASVGCISCHSVHNANPPEALKTSAHVTKTSLPAHTDAGDKLLKAPQPTLCYSCHLDQKGQFNMPIHHRVNEGVVNCTDCHDVHGTFNGNNLTASSANLRTTADQNAICTKCHTDIRGPFVFEHTPVKTEGCLACHTPHGSQNPRLLNMPSIGTLCNQCHSPLGAGARHGLDPGSTTVTPCVTCHTFIHGSNASQAFIR